MSFTVRDSQNLATGQKPRTVVFKSNQEELLSHRRSPEKAAFQLEEPYQTVAGLWFPRSARDPLCNFRFRSSYSIQKTNSYRKYNTNSQAKGRGHELRQGPTEECGYLDKDVRPIGHDDGGPDQRLDQKNSWDGHHMATISLDDSKLSISTEGLTSQDAGAEQTYLFEGGSTIGAIGPSLIIGRCHDDLWTHKAQHCVQLGKEAWGDPADYKRASSLPRYPDNLRELQRYSGTVYRSCGEEDFPRAMGEFHAQWGRTSIDEGIKLHRKNHTAIPMSWALHATSTGPEESAKLEGAVVAGTVTV
ncbi:hypothetical protein BJY52DRAFT_1221889 [Lactarius psammicola]|nr:hypothetical protein BJY52DRAFT_1221889 [Lactarius psammicola]